MENSEMPQAAASADKTKEALEAQFAKITALTERDAAHGIALRAFADYLTKGNKQARHNLSVAVEDAAIGTDLGVVVREILGVDNL